MYSKLYTALRKLFWQGGQQIIEDLAELERTEWIAPEELKAIQWEKTRQLLTNAYDEVPYYRKRFEEKGFHPQDIQTWDDFWAVPVLTRDDIRANLDTMIDPAYRDQLRPKSTSGTTGAPMKFFLDRSTFYWSAALEMRSRAWYGIQHGDKMAWIWANQSQMPGEHWSWRKRLSTYVKRRRYLNVFEISEKSMQEFGEMLTRWQPDMFRAVPSVLGLFTHYAMENGLDQIRPRLIECSAEKLTPENRRMFGAFYRAPVANCYASLELHEIAYECPRGSLHVVETRVLETVDAEGRPVPPGEVGEIVVTALHQPGMPFIRYRNGDLGRLSAEPCACGRSTPVLDEIIGRMVDLTITPEGKYVFVTFFSKLVEGKAGIVRWQIYQPDPHHIEVRLQCSTPPDLAWQAATCRRIESHFGPTVKASIRLMDRIDPLPSGKHRIIISDVAPDYIDGTPHMKAAS